MEILSQRGDSVLKLSTLQINFILSSSVISLCFELRTGLKITDSRSPVMMTGQIFFSPDKPRFWPVKLMNTIIIFLPMEYRITLAVDRCTALSFRFLPASWLKNSFTRCWVPFRDFRPFYVLVSSYGGIGSLRPISAYRWNLILFIARHVIESLLHKEEFRR